jgi:diacylglycerol kinase
MLMGVLYSLGVSTYVPLYYILTGYMPSHWTVLLPAVTLSLTLEACNTVIEHVCDFIHPEYSLQIKDIKDMSAAIAAGGHLILLLVFLFLIAINV